MNTKLVDYGIQTEKSDFRIHICPLVKRAYIYETNIVKELIQIKEFKVKGAMTGEYITAKGKVVPWNDIPGIQNISIDDDLLIGFNRELSTSEKGNRAVNIARDLIKSGEIKFPLENKEITDLDMQIEGTDIEINTKIKIQVKCDFNGGDKTKGGTGNLYIQIAECNPFGYH